MRIKNFVAPVALSLALVVAGACSIDIGSNSEPTPTPSPTPTTNGVEALDADEILTKATQALKDARYFRYAGEGADESGAPISIDLIFAEDDRQGSVASGGVDFDVVYVDDIAYAKGTADAWDTFLGSFLKAGASAQLAGKWVQLEATLSTVFAFPVDDLLKPEGTVTKGDVTTVDGTPAIELKSSKGGNLFVSLSGEPYPLKIDAPADSQGTLVFSDFGVAATVTAPSGAIKIDSYLMS